MQSHKFMRHLRLGPCLQMPYSARAPGETPIKGSTVHLRDCTLVPGLDTSLGGSRSGETSGFRLLQPGHRDRSGNGEDCIRRSTAVSSAETGRFWPHQDLPEWHPRNTQPTEGKILYPPRRYARPVHAMPVRTLSMLLESSGT